MEPLILNVRPPKKYHYDLPLKSAQTRRSTVTNLSTTPVTNSTTPVNNLSPDLATSTLKVLEAEEYVALEYSLQTKLKALEDNKRICKEKSKLKDQEMQSLATLITKLQSKIRSQEEKLHQKENTLKNISVRCQETTSGMGKDAEKVSLEARYLEEENKKYGCLQQTMQQLGKAIKDGEMQLQRLQKLNKDWQILESENNELQEQYEQLLEEKKQSQEHKIQDQRECQELSIKVERLKKVLTDRCKINNNNRNKLAKLNRQLLQSEQKLKTKNIDSNQIKGLQLDIGDLNQELLLINEDITEMEFKIKRKATTVAELRHKAELIRKQQETTYNHNHNQNSINREPSRRPTQSKQAPKQIQERQKTPTFPSNTSQEIYFNTEPPKTHLQEPQEVQQNIDQLIQRYQQICQDKKK